MLRIVRSPRKSEVYSINLRRVSDEELKQIAKQLRLGLSLEEMRAIRDHYDSINRDATDVELQTYDQTWSEHCFHKTFKGLIETPEGVIDGLLKTYIKRVADEMKPGWCFSIFEDNAGIVDLDDEYAVAIKVETHNHPSAIEPFGGAATGIGGVIRDILGVWAEPIACTDVLCFGPLDVDYISLPEGIKHPSYLFSGVVEGIGSYGNSVGIPTVNGAVYFDEDYTGNIVVYAGCIGILKKSQYIKKVKLGDCIILAGGRTGLDGIHGVTFASTVLTEKSELISRPAVQIGNPIEEEKLKRAIKQISDERLGSAITDLGGGGISCAVCETADKFMLGAEVQLDKVPLKYSRMTPWEIWISESQERMLLSVPAENVERVLQIFEDEQVEATVIGKYLENRLVKVYYEDELVAELDLEDLFNPPRLRRKTFWKPQKIDDPNFSQPDDLSVILNRLLSAPNIASKETVVRRYDHEVKGCTVIKPLQGWRAGPNDAAVLKPLYDSWRGISISSGMNPRFGKIDPYWMAASVIDEAVRNNIAVGGRRISLLDNFTWGNPEQEDRLGGLVLACCACYYVAKVYGMPFISGKDSLYNESPLGPVAPTLLITALGILPDVRKAITMDLKSIGDSIYLIGITRKELGGSEYYHLFNLLGGSVPKLDAASVSESYRKLSAAIDEGLVKACHDLSEGGLAVAAAEMAFTGDLGLEISVDSVISEEKLRDDFILFSESNGRLLVEVPKKYKEKFEELMKGSHISEIGWVTKGKSLVVRNRSRILIDSALEELYTSWKTPLGGSR